MSSVVDDDVEGESSWERFLGRVGLRRASSEPPRGLELEDAVVNTTADPVRFHCRTLLG
jgi:hypothetical protein